MPLTFSDELYNGRLGVFDDLKDDKESDSCNKSQENHLFIDLGSSSTINGYTSNYNEIKKIHKIDSLSYDDNDTDKNSDHICISEDIEDDSIVETTALRQASEPSNTTLNTTTTTDNYLTVTGTIKRGKRKGESVEVVLNMSREELEMIETKITSKKSFQCSSGPRVGVHVFLWTVLCLPFSFIISAAYSFCVGTITWYNFFTLFSERKSFGYKLIVPPILIILYPFLILSISAGLGLYAGFKQLSCCWDIWLKEFTDYEKGFYGWLCNSADIPECCPYEVVILSAIDKQ